MLIQYASLLKTLTKLGGPTPFHLELLNSNEPPFPSKKKRTKQKSKMKHTLTKS